MHKLDLVDINIKEYIYTISGKEVMLAKDTARLYNVETFRLNEVVKRNIKQFTELFKKFKEPTNTKLFFDGEVYDAYSLMLDIFGNAKKEIIIIDNYLDKNLLDILARTTKKIIIYSKNVKGFDLKKYNEQYHNIKFIITNKFHDYFIIIDKKILYHSGASFKDLGKKCFAINKIDNEEILNSLLNKI